MPITNSGFTSFLKRYSQLFVALRRFRLVYVAAEHRPFRRAERVFDRFAEGLMNAEALTPGGAMGEYFRLHRLLEAPAVRPTEQSEAGPATTPLGAIPPSRKRIPLPAVGASCRGAQALRSRRCTIRSLPLAPPYDIFGTGSAPIPGPGRGAPICSRCSPSERNPTL